jgi:AAA15 family ATPase/GTPase
MKLKNIQLSNYRNFKNYSIDFGTETTIFIGKNGTGKTNLINAIAHSLSFIFSKKKEEIQYEFIASSDANVKIESFKSTDYRFDYEIDPPHGNYSAAVSIKTTAADGEVLLSWEFLNDGESTRLKETLYRSANISFWSKYIVDGKIQKLPVFVFFHDSYPHKTANTGKNMQYKLDSGNPMPRNTGYYMWNDEKNCTDIWVQYFTMQWKNDSYDNGKGDKNYLKAVNEKLVQFSLNISKLVVNESIKIERLEVEARGKDDVLIVVFQNGNRIPFDQLPQGYKRMFSIVFDIANRTFFLNSDCESFGIAIIDEIELHLHPSIAQEVLNALKQTFPNIQFIVSTHSPLVITNFKQDDKNILNILYKLYNENGEYKNERIANLYGIDYNSGLRDWMDVSYSQSKINELFKAYKYWEKAGNKEKKKQLKDKIGEIAGKNSELYKSLN